MIGPRSRALLAAGILSSLLLAACGGSTPEPAPVISSFTATPASVVLGTPSTLTWSVTGATSIAIDPGIGVVTGASRTVTPGATTTYTLTATGPGGSATGTATVTVTAPPTVLEVACSGASCGASSPTLYSGSGAGIWRFRNTGTAARTVDLHVGGVFAGAQALLLFSNPDILPATLPSAGVLSYPPAGVQDVGALRVDGASAPDAAEDARQAWHGALVEENRRLGLLARTVAAATRPPAAAIVAPALPTPVVGDSRVWVEVMGGTPKGYDTIARAVCDLPGGRKAVLWVDPNATTSGSVTPDDVVYFRTTFCGLAGAEADGGYGRVTTLMGEVWGAVGPSEASYLISDSPTLQDVNVVFLDVPGAMADKVWAGYFWGGNNFRRSYGGPFTSSNEALAFFLDATQIHASATSRSYIGSALLHELTHMSNFYQRSVFRGTPNDTWLEETTATMIDDIVPPVATPDHYSIIPGQRIRPYVASGGGITLTGWNFPAQNSYSLAGAFGAFLNRRYGTSIVSGTTSCVSGGVECVDGLIRSAGGTGIADEFERVGASIFGLLPLTGTPDGYGYPQKVTGRYTLAPVDVAAYASSRKATAAALGESFAPGSHTYQLDTLTAGQGVFSRTGVVVPAGTSLLLVIR